MGYGRKDLKTIQIDNPDLTEVSSQLAQKAEQSDLDTTNETVALKADKSYVDSVTNSLASGSPKGVYATLTELQNDFPTGDTNIYLVSADGKWYYWNDTAWTAGGTYQSTGIADKAIVKAKLSDRVKNALYFNMDSSWEIGAIRSDIGQDLTYTTRIRTIGYFWSTDDVTVEFSDPAAEAIYEVLWYDQNKNYIDHSGWISDATYSVQDGVFFRICARYSDDRTIDETNMDTLISKFTINAPKSIDLENSIQNNTDNITILDTAIRNGNYIAENKIPNSDFSEGVTNWDYYNASVSASNGVLTLIASGGRADPRIYPIRESFEADGHILYLSSEIRVLDDVCTKLQMKVDYSNVEVDTVSNPVNGEWYRLSGIYTKQSNDTIYPRIAAIYPDSSTANGKTVEFRRIMVIDLTEVFGAGNEPDAQTIEKHISYLDNMWFKDKASIVGVKSLQEQINTLAGKSEEILDFPDFVFDFPITNAGYMADHTWVGDELWQFQSTPDDTHTGYADVNRFSVDVENKIATYLGSFTHNWGHCNSIDYCEETDTLICGNGSGNYTDNGEIYIFPNASTFKNLETVPWEQYCTVVTTASEGWGAKHNVVWGQNNNGKFNICYVITDDNKNVRKVLLGQGANDLGSGTLVSGKTGLEFNGTYKLLDEYEQSDGLEVNQGTVFYNGHLYTAIGHGGFWFAKNRLNNDGTIRREQYKDIIFDDLGNEITTKIPDGFDIHNGLIYFGNYSDSTMRVYKCPW